MRVDYEDGCLDSVPMTRAVPTLLDALLGLCL